MNAIVTILLLIGLPQAADPPPPSAVVELWPGEVPGESAPIGERRYLESKPTELCRKKLTNISRPRIKVYRPEPTRATGAAVIVAPGGGYHILAEDLEGEEVAEWLTRIGVTAVLLEYRVPRRPDQPKNEPPAGALQDAQRAVGLVRARASEWGIDPSRIGMLGFSAGGHLTAWASSNWEKRSYEPRDASDDMSCRPDFAVLIYPGYLQKSGRSTDLHPTIAVTPKSPPTFLAHAADDPVSHENSVLYHMALRRAGVPSELHIYGSGGHGFGLRPSSNPCSTWPARCEEWMKARGLLEPLK